MIKSFQVRAALMWICSAADYIILEWCNHSTHSSSDLQIERILLQTFLEFVLPLRGVALIFVLLFSQIGAIISFFIWIKGPKHEQGCRNRHWDPKQIWAVWQCWWAIGVSLCVCRPPSSHWTEPKQPPSAHSSQPGITLGHVPQRAGTPKEGW